MRRTTLPGGDSHGGDGYGGKGSPQKKNVDQVWTMSVRRLTPPPLFSRVMDTVKHFFKIGYNGPIIPIYGAILAIHGAILAI